MRPSTGERHAFVTYVVTGVFLVVFVVLVILTMMFLGTNGEGSSSKYNGVPTYVDRNYTASHTQLERTVEQNRREPGSTRASDTNGDRSR